MTVVYAMLASAAGLMTFALVPFPHSLWAAPLIGSTAVLAVPCIDYSLRWLVGLVAAALARTSED